MLVVAVDPGKRAGWALCDVEGCIRSGVVNGDDPVQVHDLLIELEPDLMVVEDQHHGSVRGGKRATWASIKTLLKRRHIWEIFADICEIPSEDVNPATWQSYWRIKRGDKAAMVSIAKTVTGRLIARDEADAVLIGLWWWCAQP